MCDCTITIRDSSGQLTTGVASDFASSVVTPTGSTISGLVSNTVDYAAVTHTVVAPATAGAGFSVQGRLAQGFTPFAQSAQSLTVVGTPTNASVVTCSGDGNTAVQARFGGSVTCRIAVRDDSGAYNSISKRLCNTYDHWRYALVVTSRSKEAGCLAHS